jgi:hypothetical protein
MLSSRSTTALRALIIRTSGVRGQFAHKVDYAYLAGIHVSPQSGSFDIRHEYNGLHFLRVELRFHHITARGDMHFVLSIHVRRDGSVECSDLCPSCLVTKGAPIYISILVSLAP